MVLCCGMSRWKWILGLVLILGVGAGVGYGIYAYPQWRQDRLIALARASMAEGDWRAAGLSLREALNSNRLNPDLYRAMAEFDFRRMSAQAVRWRKTVLELEPGGLEDIYQLASNSVALGLPIEAQAALDQLPPEEQDSERAWHLSAALALIKGDIEAGRKLFGEMADRFGQDERMELNLAKLQLISPDPAEKVQGRETLKKFSRHEEFGAQAIRALTKDALQAGELDLAQRRVHQLLAHPKTEARDFLLRLAILQRQNPGEFHEEMVRQIEVVEDDVYSAQFYLNWLLQQGLPEEVLALRPVMHPELKKSALISLMTGQALVKTGRWEEFAREHASTNWAELEFLRLAYLARAQDLAGARAEEWEPLWQQSVAATGQQPKSMNLLAQTASSWGWGEQALPLWKQLSESGAQPIQALQQMAAWHRSQRQARPLFNVYRQALRLLPRDVAVRNNYASYSLVLGEDLAAAHQLADQLYQEHREIPEIAGTYAHSLLLRGKAEEALAVLHTLDDQHRQIPEMALVEARALAALGREEAARTVLATIKPEALLIEDEEQLRLLQSELGPE